MKIGIISFAHMHAHSYARALNNHSDIEFVGISDSDAARGKQAADTYSTKYFESVDDLLDCLDAVIITSENANHHQDVLKASTKGVHILCEKPLSISVQNGSEMVRVCQENGVVLQVAFAVRYNTSVIRAKAIFDEGALGDLVAIRGTNRGTNPGGWFVDKNLAGGGAITDHTVHLVDIIRWFTGAEITEVYAESGRFYSDNETEDSGMITIELENQVFATIDCSWSRNSNYPTWGDVTMELVGTKGTLSVDAFGQMLNVYSNQGGAEWQYWGDDMDEALVNDFIHTIANNKTPSITGIDGLRAIEVVTAAYESVKLQQPVKVSRI